MAKKGQVFGEAYISSVEKTSKGQVFGEASESVKKRVATGQKAVEKTATGFPLATKDIFKELSPFPQGPLTPSNMQAAVVKSLKDKKERENKGDINPDEILGGKTLFEYVTLENAKEKAVKDEDLNVREWEILQRTGNDFLIQEQQPKYKSQVHNDEYEAELSNLRKEGENLKNEMNIAKNNWEEWKKSDYPVLAKVFDYIGNNEVNDLRREYENKKAEYESFNENYILKEREVAEKRIQKNYGVTGAEYINQLKEKKKEAKTDLEKEFYKEKIKNVREELYGKSNVFQHIGNIANEGVLQVNKGVMATLDFLLGTPAKWLGFENNIFTQLNNDATWRLQNANRETYESAQYLGDTENWSGQAGTVLIAAIPDVLITIYTGGASKSVQLGSAAINAANPTLINRITTDIVNTAKSPIFYSSFLQQLGVNYEENLESGEANKLEASLAALFASTITARMEMGGFQSLGDELAETKGVWKKFYKWVLSSFEEGIEEPGQTSATNLINKIIYDHDKSFVSTTDENAVFNPMRASKEFAIGTFVGSVLGGGQLTFNGIINAKGNSQYKEIGKAAIKTTNIQEIIDYAKSSPNDTVRLIAREVNANSISDADAGRLYQYAVSNVNEIFDDVYTVEDLNAVVNEYFLGNTPQAIKDIASASFANKLVEMNIEPNTNEVYSNLTSNSINTIDNGVDNESIEVKTDLDKAVSYYVESNIDNVNVDIEALGNKDIFAGTRKAFIRRLSNGTYESGTYGTGSGGLVQNENIIRTDSLEEAISAQYKYMLENGGEEGDRMIRKHADAYDNTHKTEAQKNITQNSDVDSGNVINISADNELSKLLGNLQRTEKYKKIKEYILGVLGGRNIKLSDGKNAIVDGRDAQHIASNAGTKKIAQISNITEIIKKSKLVAEEDSTKAKKFDYFYYYEILVKDGKETYPIYLNVGRARNDGTYHIYDITQKLRDTAHRVNDVWRPVGNAIENGISNNTVPQKAQTVNTNISTNEQNNSQNNTSESGEYGLSEPSDQEIHREPTDEEYNEAMFGEMKNAKQRHILDVAKKLDSGMKVVFVSKNAKVLSGKKGVYMRDSNTMYLSKDNSAVESYFQLFKHECIHRLESRGAYQGLKNYLFRNSSSFERYARAQLKAKYKTEFKGTREEALQALAQLYIDDVQNGSFTEKFKKGFTLEAAQREMVADFISEILFKGNRNNVAQHLADGNLEAIYDIEDTLSEFESLTETDRKWFEKIIDWIKDLIASLKGVNQNKRLVEDLEYIEKRLGRVYDSWDTKKAAKNSGGVQYSLNPYSEHQIENWKNSKNIVVYENDHQLRKFIIDAQKGINLNKKMYFGAISQELADRIKQDTGLDVNRYNCTLRASEIRKIFNDHGDEKKESLRGQRAITEDDFILIPQIIQSPDKIVLSDELFEGKPVIHFVKTINGKTTIAAYVSAKHLDLTVQTMYSGKNKGNLSIAAGEQAPANTPEANAGTVSNNSVPHEEDTVNGNSMQETENYSEVEENGEGSYSLGSPAQQMRDNLKRRESGEITKEEYLEETDRLWGEANETYGMLPQGENAKAPIATPQAVAEDKPTERFTRTIIETGTLIDEMLEGMEEKVLLGDFSYEVISDEKALEKADTAIKNGTAEDIWENVIHGKRTNKNQIAIGERLLKDAIESGNTKRVLELSAELADIFTRAGQVVQAARLLKKMTGAGRLVSAQRVVKTLNRDLRAKYGEDFPPIKISTEAATRLAEAKTESGIEHAYEEIMYEVAEQMPVTFMTKWNAWRYFAMLSNPKTHIRNVVGNAIFVPATRIRYFLAAVGEQAVSADKRTKSLVIKKEFRDFAKQDAKSQEVINLLKGNKYNDKSALREKQRIFKSDVLEFLTRFNSNALEAEDMLFKNKHYIHALAGFLQARNVNLETASQEVLDEARIYAVEEAKKATFNDESALANWIQNFGNKNLATNIAVEGVLPFKRTPINIVKRGIEYSPIGLTKTLTKGLYDVKKGKITVTEFIDGLASGLTGTGIMLAGMFLANLGLISGGEDDDEKSQFEKMLGKQEYAVEIFGKSYTIDWAAPACIPFFIGAEIVNTINDGEDFQLSQFGNAVWNSLEPITNLSMLSGMQGVIESARYAESAQTLSAIAIDAITSYGMQALPSLSGAVARTVDPTQRSWYTDKNDKWLDSTAQTIKNNIQSKVPWLSYTQIPKIDMWGREVSRGGTAERVLENFISPGYYSEIEITETSEELKRIFNKTDIDVFPNLAAKSFELEGKTKHLTANEYVTYAKAKGEYSYDYIKEFMEASSYERLTDEEKADVIGNLYEYANAKAKTTVSSYDLTKRYKTVTQWERNGRSAVDYYIYKAINK